MSDRKTYLGDSVYASCDGFHIVLTTENGYGPSNTIFLDPGVMNALSAYARQVFNARRLDDSEDGDDEDN